LISLQTLDSIIQSTYISNKLVEEKIKVFTKICHQLLLYGSEPAKNLVEDIFIPRIPSLLSRYLDNLSSLLLKDSELLPTEKDRVEAILANLDAYGELVGISI